MPPHHFLYYVSFPGSHTDIKLWLAGVSLGLEGALGAICAQVVSLKSRMGLVESILKDLQALSAALPASGNSNHYAGGKAGSSMTSSGNGSSSSASQSRLAGGAGRAATEQAAEDILAQMTCWSMARTLLKKAKSGEWSGNMVRRVNSVTPIPDVHAHGMEMAAGVGFIHWAAIQVGLPTCSPGLSACLPVAGKKSPACVATFFSRFASRIG